MKHVDPPHDAVRDRKRSRTARRLALALAAGAGGLALALPAGAAGHPAGRPLVGTVGPGFTITLTTPDGAPVRTLPAGAYAITIHDQSPIHNFHLVGPGLARTTSVPWTGTTVWRVVLKKGHYSYRCDPHRQFMHGSFAVQ